MTCFHHQTQSANFYYALNDAFIEWIHIDFNTTTPQIYRINHLNNVPVFVMGAAKQISSEQYEQVLISVLESEPELIVL